MRALRSSLGAGAAIVGLLVVAAVLAPVLAPYQPDLLAGPALDAPSRRHLLGTNDLGQDILSQLVWGARSSLVVAVLAASLATATGVVVGMTAGLAGGLIDTLIMRFIDLLLAIPGLPLMMVIASLAGPNRVVVILVVALIGWPVVARIVRSQTLSLRQRAFVAAAQGFGGRPAYLVRRHLVPGLGPVIVTRFLAWIPVAIFLEAGLSFLGLGDPLTVSWGQMLSRAAGAPGLYLTSVWIWWVLPAGLAIALTVLGFGFLGVGLEPWLNPRSRSRS